MEELYKELQDRLKELESRNPTQITESRIAELLFIISKILQIMIKTN